MPSWAPRLPPRPVVAAIRPPLGLWPSVTAMTADFHTGTGERLQIAPSPQLKIELDTQSSLRRRADTEGEGFELVGQAAIETRAGLRLALFAGAGCVIADEGAVRLDVRNTRPGTGDLPAGQRRIEHPQGRLQLQAGQATRYDERLSGVVAEAVASEVSAWTEGMLVFRRAPLRGGGGDQPLPPRQGAAG